MVGIVLTPEQIKAAPPDVRAWLRGQIDSDLGPALAAPHDAAHERPHTALETLAAMGLPEAAAVLERLRDDYPTCQVFFEFGRDGVAAQAGALFRITVAELARHTRIADGRRLIGCIEAINAAFQAVRGDATATLFAFDQQGGCYVHPSTHQSIQQLWRDVVGMACSAEPGPAARPPLAASCGGRRAGAPPAAPQTTPPAP